MKTHALYIGAGTDTIPMEHCDWIDKFTCIDSQPYSEYGVRQSGNINKYGHDGFYRDTFIDELDTCYQQIGYVISNMRSGNLRCYSKDNKYIFYYINTSIPDHHKRVQLPIAEVDSIIVSGFDPDCIFLKYTTKRLTFIGVEGTSFDKNEEKSSNELIQRLHEGTVCFFFRNYIFLHKDGSTKEFKFWDDFIQYYYELCDCYV